MVDRTIAVVNGHLVTWSDLDEQMRFEALENGRALKDLSEAERRAAFEHLVQRPDSARPDAGNGSGDGLRGGCRIGELRAGWQLEKDDAKWAATLDRYGLSAGGAARAGDKSSWRF